MEEAIRDKKLGAEERAALKEKLKQERLAEREARKEEMKKKMDEEKQKRKEERDKVWTLCPYMSFEKMK